MKKFLTVLLVIAVMFTFSFGSAFAAVDYNKAVATQYFELAMKAVKDATPASITVTDASDWYIVKYATLEAHKADLLDAYLDYAEDHGNQQTIATVVNQTTTNAASETVFVYDVTMELVADQYAADKAKALDILGTLDLSKFSTKEMDAEHVAPCYCKTYVDHVQYLINDAIAAITTDGITVDSELGDYEDAKSLVIDTYFDAYAGETTYTKLVVEKGYVGNSQSVGLGVYEVNKAYDVDGGAGSATLADYTADAVDAEEVSDAADIAGYKAAIAAAYADYLKTPDLTAAQKETAAKVKQAMDYVAEQGEGAAFRGTYAFNDATVNGKIAAAIANADAFAARAARLAAQTDATGALVRDAEDVADLVTEGTMNEYVTALGLNATVAKGYSNIVTCEGEIKDLYFGLDAEYLAYLKDRKAATVENWLETYEENETYYPAELAKVKALFDEYLAKVNAVTDVDKIDSYDSSYRTKITAVATAYKVSLLPGVGTLQSAAKTYLRDFVNAGLKGSNQLYNGYDKLDVLVADLVGNSGARTAKEIAALSEQALALVKTLPTVAAVEAADEAVEDAVYVLPGVVTLADKAVIDAAIAANDAYYDLTEADHDDFDDIQTAVKKYAYAYNNALTAKVKAVAATDKAAIKALLDEADAFVEEYDDVVTEGELYAIVGDGNTGNYDVLEGYLADIQRAEATAVTKAIVAIPVTSNITAADKATVEAARALYDAYVAEYTDPEATTVAAGFVADDFEHGALFAAEAALGLNDNSEEIAKIEAIASVEGLKITAKSSAKKGTITVKWTVEGDDANVQYYEVRKSTKKNSGYGTKPYFTTTKMTYKNTKGLEAGTRYYFKVRAVAEIDGVTYVSDWSNKAYRVAK